MNDVDEFRICWVKTHKGWCGLEQRLSGILKSNIMLRLIVTYPEQGSLSLPSDQLQLESKSSLVTTSAPNNIYSPCIYLLVLIPGCCATGAGGPSSSSSGLDLLSPAGNLLLGEEDLEVEEHNQEQRDEERA